MVLKYGKHLYYPMSQPKSLAEHCFLSTCLVPGLNSGLASQVFASCELWERDCNLCCIANFAIYLGNFGKLTFTGASKLINSVTQSRIFQRNCDTHHNCARYSSRQTVLQDSAEFLAAANRYHTINIHKPHLQLLLRSNAAFQNMHRPHPHQSVFHIGGLVQFPQICVLKGQGSLVCH